MNPSNISTSTVRPRNRRLISIDDYQDSNAPEASGFSSSQAHSRAASPLSSRAASPLPTKYPSRTTVRSASRGAELTNGHRTEREGSHKPDNRPTSRLAPGFWETSWSSLQGIASNVLGSDTQAQQRGWPDDQTRGAGLKKAPGFQKPFSFFQSRSSSTPRSREWGPPASNGRVVGAGSLEERQALVQAKRRERLLESVEEGLPDSVGKFKRRTSDDQSASAPPSEHDDRDALVYVHQVKPQDTMAGLMIRYNCQPALFRKANGFWPNDDIQIRKTVVLPLDACGVKGKRVQTPDLIPSQDGPAEGKQAAPATWPSDLSPQSPEPSNSKFGDTEPLSIYIPTEHHSDPPWKHDSWASIEGFPSPVEIARLPRRNLGFFPSNRHKSNSRPNLDDRAESLDISRTSFSTHQTNRNRRSSTSYFSQHMHGPGGVGTLGKTVASPGPAQDGLNKLFASHLPNVAPRTSFESATSSSSGIENVGGAIEGWMRKMATKASTIIEPPPGQGNGAGDLIELTDAFEIGDAEEARDDATICGDEDRARRANSSSRADEDDLLRERFPPRGRMVIDERHRKKGD